MSHTSPFRPELPEGWSYPDAESARGLHDELQRELPPGHLLAGRAVEVFAWRDGATDDVLFRHVQEPGRFTVVHLSWSGKPEINAHYPTVEYDGSFEDFVAAEQQAFDE
ncbi:MAG: hypothetical protein R3F13_01655 [Prosthecobacter sp.]